ncbi:TAXI family TRAP transporter solute-binding subunit [Pseudemcibacter aquimaris]|uniref:TAXI family TRAP transporter solute-binding subunit n=1 Tax=Pseudemcibacter aquimaris TaxID=2857064 RepID=UPI00201345C4|nr:TAXI family TRAP transporter solute-binding subunit [Pseudemcibacter aquimaris]MCC3860568.1 TAXI family TRAP transporter solute-binding subunit [Pseudemcibacter aquimaris]WDU59391.1 TAXI family TRAP transporter solute-binding subunit [Pseudemcibacter aquimaris]
MRQFFKNTALFILGFMVVLATSIPSFAQSRQFTIGTGFVGSSMHALGTVMAKHMQKNLRMRVTARPHVGPSAFMPLINAGEITMGLSSMSESNASYLGLETDPMKDVRTIGRIVTMPFAFVVRKDSGINTIEDLKGKRVVLDFAAAGALTEMTQTMLDGAGLSRDDVEVVTVSGVGQGIEAVVEGNADAAPGSVSMAAVRKANATAGITIPSLEKEGFEERLAQTASSPIRPFVVAAGSYPGIEKETRIFGMDIYIVVPASLSDVDVVKIMDVLHNNWDDMAKDYAGLANFAPAGLVHETQTVPYHKAAIEYFKSDKGGNIWDAEAEARNQKLLDVWK